MSRSEEIAKLSVGLELDSQSFSKRLSSVSKETRNLEKDFNVAKKAIDDAENSMETMEDTLKKGEKAVESLNKKLEMQEQRYDKLYKTTENQSNKYKEYQTQLKKVELDLSKLSTEENKNEQAIQNKKAEIEKITKDMEKYQQLVQKNSLKLQSYSTDIDKTKNSLNKMQKEVKKISKSLSNMNLNEATSSLKKFRDECDKLGKSINQASEKLDAMSDKTEGLSTVAGAFGALSGAAYLEADNALAKVNATLGKTDIEAQSVLDRVQTLSSKGFNFDEAVDSIIKVEQSLGDMLSSAEIDDMVAELSTMSKYFEVDMQDGIKAVTMMMKNFEISGQEATDIIAYGLQNGLNVSGDFLDTLWEYSNQFSDMGFTAEETLAIISAGMEDGAFNTDKLADGIKEFNIRLSEVGSEQEKAIGSLGLNVAQVTDAFNEGGDAGKNMALKVATELGKVEDETERNRLAVALFGTQYEDVGESVTNALSGVVNSNLDVSGSADQVKQSFEESLGAKMQGKINELKEPLIQLADKALIPLVDAAIDLSERFLEWFNTLDEGTINAIAKFGMFTIVVTPLLKIFSSIASIGSGVVSVLGKLSSKAMTAGTGAEGATSMFSKLSGILTKLPGGPIALAIGGLVALATGLGDNQKALYDLQEKFGGLGTIIGSVCEFISGITELTFGGLGNLVVLVTDLIAAMIDGAGGQTMSDAWNRFNAKQEMLTQESISKIMTETTRGMSQMRELTDVELNALSGSMNTIMSQIPQIVNGNYTQASTELATGLSTMSQTQIDSLQSLSDETRFLFTHIREGMTIDEIIPVLTNNFETMSTAGKINAEDLESSITSAMDIISGEMDTKSKEGANALDSNLNQAKQSVSTSTNQMETEASTGMANVANSFMDSSGKIPQDVKGNMDQSVQAIRQAGSDMYNGVKGSFSKMESTSKQHATNMYKGVQTSAEQMAQSAKSSATDMYRGVTTSTSKMAQQAISDWNRVRSTYSKKISGTITTTRNTINTQQTQQVDSRYIHTPKNQDVENKIKSDIMQIDTSMYMTEARSYSKTGQMNVSNTNNTESNKFNNNETQTHITLHIENFNNNSDNDLKKIADYVTDHIAHNMRRKGMV